MTMRELEDKLIKFLEENQNEHTSLEGFQVLLSAAINIYLFNLHDEKTDPLTVMTGIIEDGIKHYQRHHEELNCGRARKVSDHWGNEPKEGSE